MLKNEIEDNQKINPFNEIAVEYDHWYDINENVYFSELLAIKKFIPNEKYGLEIGVGTGRFAAKLGINIGIEPAANMAAIALARGIEVIEAVAENLPFKNSCFDFILMVCIDCFVDDIEKTYLEAFRVLKTGGSVITGLLDKNCEVARKYESMRDTREEYRNVSFHTPDEIVKILKKIGFTDFEFCQTLFTPYPSEIQMPTTGYGQGNFIVINAIKK